MVVSLTNSYPKKFLFNLRLWHNSDVDKKNQYETVPPISREKAVGLGQKQLFNGGMLEQLFFALSRGIVERSR